MSNYITGEVVLINLGTVRNKEILGHEQGNTRPCVIIKSLPEYRTYNNSTYYKN